MPVQLQKWHQCDLARPGWLFQTSKTTAAWWLPSNLRSMRLAMTCQVNDQGSRQGIFRLPQHRARLRWEDWQQLATYNFTASLFCTAGPLFRILLVAVPAFWFLRSRLCCKELCSNVPKDQHSLEEHSWYHGSTTSKVAPVRFGKNRMAFADKQNYRWMVAAIELEKYAIGHGMSNQVSRLKTRHLPSSNIFQHKAGSPWNTGVCLQICSFTFLHCTISMYDNFKPW